MKTLLVFPIIVLFLCACNPYIDATPAPVRPTDTAQATALPTKTAKPTASADATVTATSLHVRVRPGEHAPLAEPGYLYNHDVVTLTGKCQTGWAQIEWEDGLAWVKARYLSENKCHPN